MAQKFILQTDYHNIFMYIHAYHLCVRTICTVRSQYFGNQPTVSCFVLGGRANVVLASVEDQYIAMSSYKQ